MICNPALPGGGAKAIVHTALDRGVNIIDTARSYSDSERAIGEALGERRCETYIATKSLGRTASKIERELRKSLEQLGVRRIDLYQCHHIQEYREFEQLVARGGAMEALESFRKEGVIDFIGVTSHNPDILPRVLESDLFDTVQFPFSVVEREHYEKIREVAARRNIGIIIMKPLAGGHLKSVEMALKYILSHDVSTVIPGCSTVEQVVLDTEVGIGFSGMSDGDRRNIIDEASNLPDQFCRRCRYCEKVCSSGIPISDVFRCEGYLILTPPYAWDQYGKLRGSFRDCVDCGKCEDICPYNLPVRLMLARAHKRLTSGKLRFYAALLLQKMGLFDLVKKLCLRMCSLFSGAG